MVNLDVYHLAPLLLSIWDFLAPFGVPWLVWHRHSAVWRIIAVFSIGVTVIAPLYKVTGLPNLVCHLPRHTARGPQRPFGILGMFV